MWLKHTKMIFAVYGEGVVMIKHIKSSLPCFLELLTFGQIILCCGAVLCIGRCLAAPVASTH